MKLAPVPSESKHPFEKSLDSEQTFVVRCTHDEHGFDVGAASMSVAWPSVWPVPAPAAEPPRRPELRLVGADPRSIPGVGEWTGPAAAPARRRVSPAVRRRRALLALMALLTVGLALPLSGTGGHSHPTGSAPAGNISAATYTVRPGDSLWSIAERVDPTADPRPLVARLAAETGSETVVPGERIALPST
jgi:LysM domain